MNFHNRAHFSNRGYCKTHDFIFEAQYVEGKQKGEALPVVGTHPFFIYFWTFAVPS